MTDLGFKMRSLFTVYILQPSWVETLDSQQKEVLIWGSLTRSSLPHLTDTSQRRKVLDRTKMTWYPVKVAAHGNRAPKEIIEN